MKYSYLSLLLLLFTLTQSCRTIPGESLAVSEVQLVMPVEPSPQLLASCVQDSLKKVRAATVALNAGGFASGVIISPDGYVLTAAHVMLMIKEGQKVTIILEDGRKASLRPLGYNGQHDIALLKIIGESDEPWPYVELAANPVKLGDFCFTLAHPTGLVAGRSAQARMGRITSLKLCDKLPATIYADCNIQPGDSGGPLYDLDGRLIGIDSSAAGYIGFNMFATVSRFLLDKKRYFKGDVWGDPLLGPTNPASVNGKITKEALTIMQNTFMKRVKDKHRGTMDFVRPKISPKGELEVDQQDIVNALGKDASPIVKGQKVCVGLDAPFLLRQLPKLPVGSGRPIPVKSGKTIITYGVPVTQNMLLVKLSEVQKVKSVLRIKEGGFALKIVAKDQAWDLALLNVGNKIKLKPLVWPSAQPKIEQGEALLAPDMYGRLNWGVASGLPYEVKRGRSKGPLRDKTLVSKHRSPYKSVLPHSLPLFAKDAGTPVYNFAGELVGIHMARLNRTMGLIITAVDLQKSVQKMLDF